MSQFDICAIGNALVDVIADADDALLAAQGVTKGAMTLIDIERAEALGAVMVNPVETSGGAGANTAVGVASFGGRAAFMGRTGGDRLGKLYADDLKKQNVYFAAAPVLNDGARSGRCLIFVTPDAQRSMNTCLGAAVSFGPEDVQPAVLQESQVTYLEGFLFDPDQAQAAFHKAAEIVRAAGRELALTLSDTFCVDRHRAEFRALVRDEVDILFCNEGELQALYQTPDLAAALAAARQDCAIVVTTRGPQGAVIARGAETVEIAAAPVAKVIDTTGAGDLFAAGFLYGYTQGKDLAEAGRLGAIAAAEVISHYGPRPQISLAGLVRSETAALKIN